jgi:uncharacterized protein
MRPLRIAILAKAPRPGFAKTRLIPALGAHGAAKLAARMLQTTLSAAVEAGVGAVELCVTPDIDDDAWVGIDLPADIGITAQGDGDIGVRMARIARRADAHDEALLLVGTDCAEMSPALLRDAATLLVNTDAVLHPTADGGYAVLGLNRHHPRLFTDIAWSTGSVADTTVRRLAELGWRAHVGRTLHDIDEPDDLKWLANHRAASA